MHKVRRINQLFYLLQQSQEKLADGKQDPVTAAAQNIQALLDQLSTTYPSSTMPEQMILATKAIEQIETNPPLKARVISALKASSVEVLRELVAHPAVAILLAAIDGWKQAEGWCSFLNKQKFRYDCKGNAIAFRLRI